MQRSINSKPSWPMNSISIDPADILTPSLPHLASSPHLNSTLNGTETGTGPQELTIQGGLGRFAARSNAEIGQITLTAASEGIRGASLNLVSL